MMRLFPLVLILHTLAWQAMAQDPKITEEYRVNLVELEVKAMTLGGEFIPDLSPQDFIVKENGKVMDVSSIEEVRIGRLSQAEAAVHRSRIMLLLDFDNSSVPMMARAFPQVREFINTLYVGRHEVGLALNSNGVAVVTPFTRNREALLRGVDLAEQHFKTTRNRSRGIGFGGREQPLSQNLSTYFREQTHVMGQFVNYLGAWSGKKNLIVISELSHFSTDLNNGIEDSYYRLSVKDIQSACLDHKITINTLTLSRGYERLENQNMLDLASLTAGFNLRTSHRELGDFIENIIHKMEHYYLVRYYSDYDSPRFRNIDISVKGVGRLARNLGGYFPKSKFVKPELAGAALAFARDYSSVLSANTAWMTWESNSLFGVRKKSAFYAVAQRVFDTRGNLLAEKVTTRELERVKEKGQWFTPDINENLSFELNYEGPVQIETEIMDLNSGRFVRFTADAEGWEPDQTKI